VNGRVLTETGVAASIRFRRRVLALDEAPRPGDQVLDLQGAWVLPGLINAHDHLELNHYGAWHGDAGYTNASQWIEQVGAALQRDAAARGRRAWPLAARLFAGALKNVLAGVTTVAHHNPFYREIGRRLPVRVVRRYGWAHSFYLQRGRAGANGEPAGEVPARHAATPASAPFILHIGEGTDDEARGELARLCELGCLTPNALLVHGLAFSAADWQTVVGQGASLAWCPSSNLAMFGRTAPLGLWLDCAPASVSHVTLGSDSRLTGSRDLLEELKVAAKLLPSDTLGLLAMVTGHAARALSLPAAGRIACGLPADLVVVPAAGGHAASALLAASRRDLALVVLDGRPVVGDPGWRRAFDARGVPCSPACVDGREKVVARRLAADVRALPEPEEGVRWAA
jgi:cytosine/adenosine deaminase-related metal-dependent hydrolase